jgi:hypothetical protein
MDRITAVAVFTLILIFLSLNAFAASPPVEMTQNAKTIPLYGEFEASVASDFGAINPFNYSSVVCQAYVISPDKRNYIMDGFYCRDFDFSYDTGIYTEKAGAFRVRICPWKPGKWTFFLTVVKDGREVYRSPAGSFLVKGARETDGFIKVSKNDPLFLEFSSGAPFFGLGMDTAWPSDRGLNDFKDWFEKLHSAGANMARVWMAPWSFGIEWDGQVGDYGARQKQAFMVDKLFELAKKNDIYIMLTLVAHGEFSTKTNPEWDKNPYNIKNDGILDRPEDFFTSVAAKQAFKNRLRYIMARWGSRGNLLAWELFNEVDLTDNYSTQAVADWHSEMLDFLKSRDIYKHLLTTSFSRPDMDPAVWNLSRIDMVQTHIYNMRDEAPQVYEASRAKIENYAKPHIMGEFGMDADGDFAKNNSDPGGIGLHNCLWAGAMSLSCAAPMSWYWKEYIDRNNLYNEFASLGKFISGVNWPKEGFIDLQNRQLFLKKVPDGLKGGDVSIFPVDAWEKARKEEFMVKPDGTVTNKDGFIAYLFGKGHQDMKTVPIISFKNEEPVQLVIRVNKVSQDNILSVSINNIAAFSVTVSAAAEPSKKYLEQYKVWQADIASEFTVDIPAGDNDVALENKGDDWVRIESIKIKGFLNPAVAPEFVAGMQSKDMALLWIKNGNYNYYNRTPQAVPDSYLDITGLAPGRYVIEYYDTYAATVTAKSDYIVDEDTLRVEVPALEKDMAIRVGKFKK